MFYFQRQAARKWSGRLGQLQLYSAVLVGWPGQAVLVSPLTATPIGRECRTSSAEPSPSVVSRGQLTEVALVHGLALPSHAADTQSAALHVTAPNFP